MVDRLTKELRKLSRQELKRVLAALEKLERGEVDTLQVKALKGRDALYRVRVGRLRIVYRMADDGEILLLAVRWRDEQTYRDV